MQSGEDGSHVFVRIRNEWSLESKQLRRAITITRRILLPCLLSCLISQLGAFPGKAHVEVFPPSPLQLPPLTSLPASLTPLPATLELQHSMIYQIKKKSLAPNLFCVNIPQCIPSCAASPAPRVALWHLSCLGPCSNKAERSKTAKGHILGFSIFSPQSHFKFSLWGNKAGDIF